jgi:hypothetical protein
MPKHLRKLPISGTVTGIGGGGRRAGAGTEGRPTGTPKIVVDTSAAGWRNGTVPMMMFNGIDSFDDKWPNFTES